MDLDQNLRELTEDNKLDLDQAIESIDFETVMLVNDLQNNIDGSNELTVENALQALRSKKFNNIETDLSNLKKTLDRLFRDDAKENVSIVLANTLSKIIIRADRKITKITNSDDKTMDIEKMNNINTIKNILLFILEEFDQNLKSEDKTSLNKVYGNIIALIESTPHELQEMANSNSPSKAANDKPSELGASGSNHSSEASVSSNSEEGPSSYDSEEGSSSSDSEDAASDYSDTVWVSWDDHLNGLFWVIRFNKKPRNISGFLLLINLK